MCSQNSSESIHDLVSKLDVSASRIGAAVVSALALLGFAVVQLLSAGHDANAVGIDIFTLISVWNAAPGGADEYDARLVAAFFHLESCVMLFLLSILTGAVSYSMWNTRNVVSKIRDSLTST